MANRRAITRAQAAKYRSATRAGKSEILDAVCAVTGFNRDYARRALKRALKPRVVRPRAARAPKYDGRVVAALEKCWAVVNAPAGKRLAPILGELVPLLRRHGELDIDDDLEFLLIAMSAAPLDLRARDQAAEVARRPGKPSRPRGRQQPLRRDPPARRRDLRRDQAGHGLKVPDPPDPG